MKAKVFMMNYKGFFEITDKKLSRSTVTTSDLQSLLQRKSTIN